MANTLFRYDRPVKVEVRAVGLKAMRERRGLTQRRLAHDLGISAGFRQVGPGDTTPPSLVSIGFTPTTVDTSQAPATCIRPS